MSLRTIESKDLAYFKSILDAKNVLTDEENLYKYSHDETEDISVIPGVALKPESKEEVALILKYCNKEGIPVTPSGARTGLSGGAIPLKGGVNLSMERFNKILKIDAKNYQVTVEPGVIVEELQNTLKAEGLFYPPDPASKGSCFIGGNLSENSGGPKAVKYGVTNEYVLNLEVVLPNGEIIWTGANVLKNATGYNLTQLIVGSEGTLGVITKAVLKLLPHPTQDLLVLVPFRSAVQACEAVAAIFNAGIVPSGMEFMERDAILYTLDFMGDSTISVPEDIEAHLLIEVDGNNKDVLFGEIEKIMGVLDQFDTDEVLFAEDQSQKDKLWSIRRKVGEAVKAQSIYKEEDTVVPRFELPELLKTVKSIGKEFGFQSVCYGHAGDGNLHINILKGEMTDKQWNDDLGKAIRKLFEKVVALGGTISGEHGIGLVQKSYMDIPFGKVELDLMKGIKGVFDPNGILNPDKVLK
ncbi:MAG: FAD-binding oxidoreductase [Crocinitomicaceae bacterium]|nr:FAD-binding oxidoreductase [Crocinitomicaceae bacterium]